MGEKKHARGERQRRRLRNGNGGSDGLASGRAIVMISKQVSLNAKMLSAKQLCDRRVRCCSYQHLP